MEKPRRLWRRRIPKSQEGRLKYQRGDPHALNIQEEEAPPGSGGAGSSKRDRYPNDWQAYRRIRHVPERLEAEDETLATFLLEHYADRKHVDHIQETLLIFRRNRALARIQVAQVALSLAQELLAPDPLIPELIALLEAGSAPTIQAEVNREQLTGLPRLLDTQLAQVKERLHEIQVALSRGNGWIELQYVRRERVRSIVVRYVLALNQQREDGSPVPAALEPGSWSPELAAVIRARQEIPEHLEPLVYESITYGPYPFFSLARREQRACLRDQLGRCFG